VPFVKVWSPDDIVEVDERDTHYSSTFTRIETREYLLFLVPGSYALTCVRRFRCEPNLAETRIDDALNHVRAAGGNGLRWAVTPRTLPTDTPQRLLRRGFENFATAETLFFEFGPQDKPLPSTTLAHSTLSVREVFTEPEIDAFVRMGETIFGDPLPPADYTQRFREAVHRSIETTGHSELFLTYEGKTPVARGGLTVTGSVGRLWTAGVLPEHRGKGAYMALTEARCRSALAQGAQVVLTHARLGTSEPILKRHGFRSAGPYVYYQLRWP
jgi:hypothetical protein